jgi:site-specific recombinase XerC
MAKYRSMTELAELQPSWELAMRAERKSPHTIASYLAGVRAYLAWCESTEKPGLSRPGVQAWVADLLDGGDQPTTVIAKLKGVRQFCKWLVAEGELDADPLLGMRSPKVDHKVTPALDDCQLAALIKACDGRSLRDRRDEAIIRLLAETGARASELLALQIPDVDLKRGLVVISRSKGGKGRTVPIGAQTCLALDRYMRLRRQAGFDGGKLWIGKTGTFGYYGLEHCLKTRGAAAGIDGLHAHLLRHTFATRWKAARGSDDGLMAVAGWSSRSMIDRYSGAAAASRAADEARRLALGDL